MLNENQTALLELLKATLFHIEPLLPENTDWEAVFAEAKKHAVVALAAPAVPNGAAHNWAEAVDQNTAHWLQLLHAQRNLTQMLDAEQIPFVILKGAAAAISYPNPIQRTMGDVDLLVPPDQFEKAKTLMASSGYVVRYGDNEDGRHIGLVKDGILFELHRRFSSFGLDIEPSILAGLARRETASVMGASFPMLPTLENGLVLLAHMRQHLIEADYSLGLRQVIDWMMYVHANAADDRWETAFAALTRQYGLDRLAATMTAACNRFLGLPDRLAWEADGETVNELFERIVSGGNFADQKSGDALKDNPVQDTMEAMRQEGFFRYLQRGGLQNWKAAQRFRLLRPFAWLYQLFRYVGLILARIFAGKPLTKELAAGKKENDFKKRIGV